MLAFVFECLSIKILLNRGLLRAALDNQREQITYIGFVLPVQCAHDAFCRWSCSLPHAVRSERTRKHRADDGRHNVFRIENADSGSESKLNGTASQSQKRRETRPRCCATSVAIGLILSHAGALQFIWRRRYRLFRSRILGTHCFVSGTEAQPNYAWSRNQATKRPFICVRKD